LERAGSDFHCIKCGCKLKCRNGDRVSNLFAYVFGVCDFNGNIIICKVVNSPQISYDANWGNGIVTISFDWVEQGKYNDYNDMTELGLIDPLYETLYEVGHIWSSPSYAYGIPSVQN
jgi:hypothetical protein